MPFVFPAARLSSAACVCRPALVACSVHAPVAAGPGDSLLADELAVSQLAEGSAAAEQVRSLAAGRVHCGAEDDSSLDAADLAPADSQAERSAAPWMDAHSEQVVLQAGSCPDGCKPEADCLAPADSAAQKVIGHCVQGAQTDGYPADCSETAGLAAADTPDSAGSVQAGSVAVG